MLATITTEVILIMFTDYSFLNKKLADGVFLRKWTQTRIHLI